jgi:hypothetical protein
VRVGAESHVKLWSTSPAGHVLWVTLAACDENFQPTANLATLQAIGEGPPANQIENVVFGGPLAFVLSRSGPVPPKDRETTEWNLFRAVISAQGELSIRVDDRQTWYFQVARAGDPSDHAVVADGTVPFQDQTAFKIIYGPFGCANVTGPVVDATTGDPLPGAQLMSNAGFSAITDAQGDFSLAAADDTCVPAFPASISSSPAR